MRPSTVAVVTGIAALAATVADAAQRYAVRDLGATAGAESRPFGINNQIQIAGVNRTAGVYRAFLWQNGAWTNLGTLGGTYSRGNGISDAGHVTGASTNATGAQRGFLWTPGGTDGVPGNPQMKEIGALGGSASSASAVNALGHVAGMAATATREQAILYNGTSISNIGLAVQAGLGLSWSYGYGINQEDVVVGEAYNNDFTQRRAFLYATGTATNLGHLGGDQASATAVNSNRQVVGYSTAINGFDHAFRWDSGIMQDLGTLGGNYSYGYAINNLGAVVGTSSVDPADTNFHAFIASGDTMVDLNTRLDNTGTNWILTEARGINDSGQIIGLGSRLGSIRGFLLNPIPVIAGAAVENANGILSFHSINAAPYRVDSTTNLLGPVVWTEGSQIVTGNGRIVSATNPLNSPIEFRRVHLLGP